MAVLRYNTISLAVRCSTCLLLGCYSTSLAGRTDSETVEDASSDSFLDTDTDSSIPDSLNDILLDFLDDPPPSSCHIIDQSGCPDGTWCSWSVDDWTCTVYETCVVRPAGTIEPGEPCLSAVEPLCMPGSECFWNHSVPEAGDRETCHEWCMTDDDCSVPSSTCSIEIEFTVMVGPCRSTSIIYPYLLCSNP
jgi:hypothetical protein